MSDPSPRPPRSNGIIETALYVESAARSADFYEQIFDFQLIAPARSEVSDETRLCAMRAGDRSVLLLFKRGATHDTDASGSIHLAFAIAREDLETWERWLSSQSIPIQSRKTWDFGGQSLYFRDPDGHLLEVVTPGVWSIY